MRPLVQLGVGLALSAAACSSEDNASSPDDLVTATGGSSTTGTGGSTPGAGGSTTGGARSGGAAGTGEMENGTGGSTSGGTSNGTGGTNADGGPASTGGGSNAPGGTANGTGGANTGFSNDTFLPWHGGPSYYSKWTHGIPADEDFFPIAVWLQSPSNANRYKNVGVNLFIGLWDGPTNAQLSDLASAGMPTFCDQSHDWNSHLDDSTVYGWLQGDEPDNAQSNGSGGYDPCIPPSTIIARHDAWAANDSTRPVWLNLGRGVSDTNWVGRGDCTGRTDMYTDYAKGGDILSFDIYPVNDGNSNGLDAVPKGVDNLREWSNYQKPVISAIEGSNIDNTTRPSPSQIETEVWMALIHGAAGVMYFCHRFSPTFSETDCLDNTTTADGLKKIDGQVETLAPVLNQPSVGNGVTVTSSASGVPIDVMLKRHSGATYVFAVVMKNESTTGTFTLRDFGDAASVEVIDENRTVPVSAGVFEDDFAGYAVHRYKITR